MALLIFNKVCHFMCENLIVNKIKWHDSIVDILDSAVLRMMKRMKVFRCTQKFDAYQNKNRVGLFFRFFFFSTVELLQDSDFILCDERRMIIYGNCLLIRFVQIFQLRNFAIANNWQYTCQCQFHLAPKHFFSSYN